MFLGTSGGGDSRSERCIGFVKKILSFKYASSESMFLRPCESRL